MEMPHFKSFNSHLNPDKVWIEIERLLLILNAFSTKRAIDQKHAPSLLPVVQFPLHI